MSRIAAVIALLLAPPLGLNGQVAEATAIVQNFTFSQPGAIGASSVRFVTTPLAVSLRLPGRATLSVASASAQATLTGIDGESIDFGGLADTRLGVTVPLVLEGLSLTARGTLPSGTASMSQAEAAVAGMMASHLLPVPIRSLGQGGAFGAELAYAVTSEDVTVAVGIGYDVAREFEPLTDDPVVYAPGRQLRGRATADIRTGVTSLLSVMLGVQRIGRDELDGVELFEPGLRIEALASYGFAVSAQGSVLLYGAVHRRATGIPGLNPDVALTVDATGFPYVPGVIAAEAQSLVVAGAEVRIPTRYFAFIPEARVRRFTSGDTVGRGWLATVGVALDVRLLGRRGGRRLQAAPAVRLTTGSASGGAGLESSLTGWEAGITLQLAGGR